MQHAPVEAQSALHVDGSQVVGCRHEDTRVQQPVGRDERLLAKVLRALPHTTHAGGKFPSLQVLHQVAHIVRHRVQPEVERILVGAFLILLAPVLLVAHDGFQTVLAQPEGVVPDGLVVVDVLEG